MKRVIAARAAAGVMVVTAFQVIKLHRRATSLELKSLYDVR